MWLFQRLIDMFPWPSLWLQLGAFHIVKIKPQCMFQNGFSLFASDFVDSTVYVTWMSIAEISLQLWDGPRALFLSHQAFRTPVTTTPGAFLTSFAFFSAGTIWQSKFDLYLRRQSNFGHVPQFIPCYYRVNHLLKHPVVTAYGQLIRVREGEQF
jgi:hypothetical protein